MNINDAIRNPTLLFQGSLGFQVVFLLLHQAIEYELISFAEAG